MLNLFYSNPCRDNILCLSIKINCKAVIYDFSDRTVLLWYTKELAVKEKRSLRVNIEFDHATLVRWSPDGKAFLIHKAVANTIEVYKISKKPDGTLASAIKALEFSKVSTKFFL